MVGPDASGILVLNRTPLALNLLTRFRRQVKDNWVNHALKTATGEQTRARVFLRRSLGREPTEDEVEATKKDKSLKGRITTAQVMEDFNSGIEVLPSFDISSSDQ